MEHKGIAPMDQQYVLDELEEGLSGNSYKCRLQRVSDGGAWCVREIRLCSLRNARVGCRIGRPFSIHGQYVRRASHAQARAVVDGVGRSEQFQEPSKSSSPRLTSFDARVREHAHGVLGPCVGNGNHRR